MENRKKKHILVIEDEKHIAEGLKLNLSLQGYDVSIAQDGVSGLQKWKENRPDLIILDIMMPGIDGISVLRNIRLEDERIPILILSAKGTPDDKIKGLSYGVDDYLSKPFNLEEFLLRVERLLTRVDIYNTADIYNTIEELNVDGCRALFASTGVKDDSLPAHYYVDELLAYNSVNTAPIDTIKAFHANGAKKKRLPISNEVIQEHFEKIQEIGINFDEVLDKQISEGLVAFENAFRDILENL